MDISELEKFKNIKLLVIDVDGTMTDGGIYYDNFGNEMKKFCTKDAAGFFAAHQVGLKIMVLTGRECNAVTKRMKELSVEWICQDVKDKYAYLKNHMNLMNYSFENVGYIGDDLNDFKPMKLAMFKGCPQDACEEVLTIADYVSSVKGGYGAVRDIICYLLKKMGSWSYAIEQVYDLGLYERENVK
jgi:3-deoxy-D-manno-octulosonate 8-phosphate phosphatase (KDO 8-P phosphatase)